MRRRLLKAALGTLVLAAWTGAHAQAPFPSKPVHVVVPFAAGGINDLVARMVAPTMADTLGQPVIVDNRPGAGGVLATETVGKSPADGYTLLVAFDSFAANPYLYKSAQYDPVRDFEPVSWIVRTRLLLAVPPSLGVHTLAEFVALAKKRGSLMNYATAGGGTSSHLVAELFKLTAGIDPTPIHYPGGAPAVTDLLGSHVDMMMPTMNTVLPYVQSGKLLALAVTSAAHSPLLPSVPAIAETYPGFEAQSWVGFVAPAGTPKPVLARLHGAVSKASAAPEVRKKMEELGLELVDTSGDAFGDWIKAESNRWSRVIRE
ncbi:MAG: tripartite tricarboxylate transporter substrate binding protein, partial [Chloroflexota bacterium]|nr:tripartite tricarboxylate transporter substrate binding protein [Chloroflexota bacterium]